MTESNYKVIFRADAQSNQHRITWEEKCPIQLSAVQISRDTTTTATFLQVKVKNISNDPIVSIAAALTIEVPDKPDEAMPLEYLDTDIPAGTEKTLKPQRLAQANITSCNLVIRRVDFSNKTWHSTTSPKPLPQRQALSLSPKARAQRAYALSLGENDEIVNGTVQDHSGWWVCACGQANIGRATCCKCGTVKERLLDTENEQDLLAEYNDRVDDIYEQACDLSKDDASKKELKTASKLFTSIKDEKDSAEKAKGCDERIQSISSAQGRKIRRGVITATTSVVALGLIIALGIFVIVPNVKYAIAANYANSGQYKDAIAAFEELGDFKDSPKRAIQCKVDDCETQVRNALESDNYDEAYRCAQTLAGLDGGWDRLEPIAEAAAESFMQQQDYGRAEKWFAFTHNEESRKTAMYQYATNHLNHDDQATYFYLKELSEANYKDAASLYDQLYYWQFEFGISTSEQAKDQNTWEGKNFGNVYAFAKATNGPLSSSNSSEKATIRIEVSAHYEETGSKPERWESSSDQFSVTSSGKVPSTKYVGIIGGSAVYGGADYYKVTFFNNDTGEYLGEKEIQCVN